MSLVLSENISFKSTTFSKLKNKFIFWYGFYNVMISSYAVKNCTPHINQNTKKIIYEIKIAQAQSSWYNEKDWVLEPGPLLLWEFGQISHILVHKIRTVRLKL